jgi:hypothetical protein
MGLGQLVTLGPQCSDLRHELDGDSQLSAGKVFRQLDVDVFRAGDPHDCAILSPCRLSEETLAGRSIRDEDLPCVAARGTRQIGVAQEFAIFKRSGCARTQLRV